MKLKYETFSPFWVMDEVRDGKTVYVLDRETKTVFDINSLPLDRAFNVIKSAESNSGRYDFWHEVLVDNG